MIWHLTRGNDSAHWKPLAKDTSTGKDTTREDPHAQRNSREPHLIDRWSLIMASCSILNQVLTFSHRIHPLTFLFSWKEAFVVLLAGLQGISLAPYVLQWVYNNSYITSTDTESLLLQPKWWVLTILRKQLHWPQCATPNPYWQERGLFICYVSFKDFTCSVALLILLIAHIRIKSTTAMLHMNDICQSCHLKHQQKD